MSNRMPTMLAMTVNNSSADDDSPRQPDPREDDRASAQSRRYLRTLYDSEVLYDNHSR